jgi:hypothetical protein
METVASIMETVKGLGFDVYQRDPADTFCIYSNGHNLAYFQIDPVRGCWHVSTVHKANRQTGTGYRMTEGSWDTPDRETLEKGFAFCPDWASNADRRTVKKFDGIGEYQAQSGFHADYKKI